MKRENSKVRNRRKDRRALQRAMCRTLANCWLEGMPEPGDLPRQVRAVLYGLEMARRAK